MRVTPTALLGSWVLQPIKDMTSLGTDFETHAKWQGSVEEPALKDFVARKVRTIELNKVQGTHWNTIKCEEHLGSHPEAVFRQATINLDSRVWKSLGDSLPELYCVDLAGVYVTQESVSSRILREEKRYGLQLPNGRLHEKSSAKGGMGKETGTNSCTRFPQASCFEKTRHVCQKYGAACMTWYSENQRYKKMRLDIGFPCSRERCEETSK